MNTISDDILLLLAQTLDIDSFFNFRLVCRKHYDLTNSHMRGLAPEVARSTFPRLSKILDDQGFQRSPTPLESVRWLKRLRYEYLAAVMFEHADPHQKAQINADLTSYGFDPLIVVASGWHVLARLSKLTRQADLRFRSRYNEPSRMVDLGCEERTWNLHLCRQWLDFVGTRKMSELYGFKWLFRCLIHNVFEFKGTGLSNSDCVAWLMTWIFGAGPEPFWTQWTMETATSSNCLLKMSVEIAWQKQRLPLQKWELDNVRNIERQVSIILRLASQGYDGYDFADPSYLHTAKMERMRCLTRQSGPDHFTSWVGVLRIKPVADPHLWFRSVTFKAPIDWMLLGYEPPMPLPKKEASQIPNRRRGERCCYPSEPRQKVFGSRHRNLFRSWRKAWKPALCGEYDEDLLQKRLARMYGPSGRDPGLLYG